MILKLSLLQARPDTFYDRFDLYPAISAGVGNKQTLAQFVPCGTCPATLFQKPGIKLAEASTCHLEADQSENLLNLLQIFAPLKPVEENAGGEAVRGPSRRFHGGYLSLKRCWKRGARIRSL